MSTVDAVCVGMGWAGGILAAEAGMSVVGLERGGWRGRRTFAYAHDEVRYAVGAEHRCRDLDAAAQPRRARAAHPPHRVLRARQRVRRYRGVVGGAGRFSPRDFAVRGRTVARYGEQAIPAGDPMSGPWSPTLGERIKEIVGHGRRRHARRRCAARPLRHVVIPSTHNTGGVIVGVDPRTSAVNSYLQMWDFPNVFVVGTSARARPGPLV